jgi:hypothetical protein
MLAESNDIQDSKRSRKLLEQVRMTCGELKMEPLRRAAEQLLATL